MPECHSAPASGRDADPGWSSPAKRKRPTPRTCPAQGTSGKQLFTGKFLRPRRARLWESLISKVETWSSTISMVASVKFANESMILKLPTSYMSSDLRQKHRDIIATQECGRPLQFSHGDGFLHPSLTVAGSCLSRTSHVAVVLFCANWLSSYDPGQHMHQATRESVLHSERDVFTSASPRHARSEIGATLLLQGYVQVDALEAHIARDLGLDLFFISTFCFVFESLAAL